MVKRLLAGRDSFNAPFYDSPYSTFVADNAQVTRVAPGSKCCGWELRCLLEAASGTQFQKYAWLLQLERCLSNRALICFLAAGTL